MMKRILRSYWTNVLVIVLLGWMCISLFPTSEQFAKLFKDPEPPWVIDIPIAPFAVVFIVAVILAILDTIVKRRDGRGLFSIIFVPSEFIEDDERERMVTAKACRAAYMAMWIAAPVIAVAMMYYPLFRDELPYAPVLAILLLIFIQLTTYHVSVRRNM